MNRILITGASGFVGKHLIELLSKDSDLIYGTYLTDESKKGLEEFKNLQLEKIDLLDEDKVLELVEKSKPDLIFHLAAVTSPGDSFKDPKGTIVNNVDVEINIFEAVRKLGLKSKILVTSSADIYGKVESENLPINEECPLNPTNPYAVSKIAQDYLALQYFNSYGLSTIRVRAFNHVGPGQSPNFVISSFAKKIAEIEKGIESEMLVGNLDAKRDFTDVRDMVKAYSLIIENGKPGDVYNIGSGKSYRISEALDQLISLSKVKITVKTDPEMLRPVDNPELVCDATKIGKVIDWSPSIPFSKTLEDTLSYWRENI